VDASTLAPLQRLGAARYELLPFSEKDLERFSEHWFAGERGSEPVTIPV
jgi:cellulose synthase operon protein C